jgi:hypothetical protein
LKERLAARACFSTRKQPWFEGGWIDPAGLQITLFF